MTTSREVRTMGLLWSQFHTSFFRRFLVADWFTTRKREAQLSHVVETRFYGISQHYHGYTYITLPSNHSFDSLIMTTKQVFRNYPPPNLYCSISRRFFKLISNIDLSLTHTISYHQEVFLKGHQNSASKGQLNRLFHTFTD